MIKLATILLLLVSTLSFSESELMIQIYRESDRDKMLNMFSSENIPYKLINENQIYYPASFQDKVKEIKARVWGPIDNTKKGVSVKRDVAPTLAAELVKNGVPYSVNSDSVTSTFTWQINHDKLAMELVYKVLD